MFVPLRHGVGRVGLVVGWGLGIVSRVTSEIGTVVISGLNIRRSRIAARTDFAGSLKTSSLSAMRLVVRFRGRFNVSVPSSRTRGVNAMNSTMSCVRRRTGWSSFVGVRLGEIMMANLNTVAPINGDMPRF